MCELPAYPIFFPTYTPIETGYARDWWWYDPDVCAEDVGPFDNRSEAVADWALNHFCHYLRQDISAFGLALETPCLQAPIPQRIADKAAAGVAYAELARDLELPELEGMTEQALAVTESLIALAVEFGDIVAFQSGREARAELQALPGGSR